jgi:trk system potassium uptake protein TrkA
MADELYKLILTPNIVDNQDFFDGAIKLIGFKIRDYSSILGKPIFALEEKLRQHGFHIGIIQRTNRSIIPETNEVIKENDTVYFLCESSQYQTLRRFLGYERVQKKIRGIFIIGGGHMGLVLAKKLEEANQEVKVIEKSLSRSFHIAEKLQKSLVLHFDGTDLKELKAEGIENTDHFIAITDSEQINLSSCLIASEQGVKRTFCLVKQPELIQIINQNTPITLGISPRVITARYLVRFIQGANISAYFSPFNSQIEVLEIHLDARAPCLNSSLKELDLPENVKIGIIKRKNRYLLPTGKDILRTGDTILLILHRLDRNQAMRIFQQPST